MTGLAVVVCSRDRPQRLRDCLRAVVEQHADEILVVDSASSTSATTSVAAEFGVETVRVGQPGLARARNAAMRATTADITAFTDDDCVPRHDWAQAIRARFTKSATEGERIGFVTGRVVAEGEGQPVSVLLGAVPRRYAGGDDASYIGHGANLAVARACWESLGGFDELLGVGASLRSAEDTDLMWRAMREGWIGHFEPQAVVSHTQWRGRGAALRASYGYGVGAGALRSKVGRMGGHQASRRFAAGSLRHTAKQLAADARAGYEFGVAVNLVRAAGIAVGRVRAARLPIVDGRFGPQ
ncbi:MAG TPA: glycosyltransferase [Mycobacteriales bacterium]|nr:glycosyltransferase [Mycobacteriales bacterium]HWC34238.1 glycosyltransferase [Mycobacteriales bacterium]